jgi:uncharacterized protein
LELIKSNIINKTIDFVKMTLEGAEAGHDWYHIDRVFKMSQFLQSKEGGDVFIVSMAALLHDISDAKFNGGNDDLGAEVAVNYMEKLQISKSNIEAIGNVIRNVSFKGGNVEVSHHSIELNIVQDADRLDGLGAIGIARAFHYGGYKNNIFYDPEIQPRYGMTKEEYRNHKSTTINHFYEKLLLVKDRMNTETGKTMAEKRHRVLERFLDDFYEEWNAVVEN